MDIIVITVLLVAILLLGMMGGIYSDDHENVSMIFIGGGIVVGIFVLFMIWNPTSPKAIDVYRNKTELKITYEGKTPVDTVVIFKK